MKGSWLRTYSMVSPLSGYPQNSQSKEFGKVLKRASLSFFVHFINLDLLIQISINRNLCSSPSLVLILTTIPTDSFLAVQLRVGTWLSHEILLTSVKSSGMVCHFRKHAGHINLCCEELACVLIMLSRLCFAPLQGSVWQ